MMHSFKYESGDARMTIGPVAAEPWRPLHLPNKHSILNIILAQQYTKGVSTKKV